MKFLAIESLRISLKLNISAALACMTGALRAKRGERDISRGARHERKARDEGKRKIKVVWVLFTVSFQSFVWHLVILPFRKARKVCLNSPLSNVNKLLFL